jgi:hypothetical protein
MSKYPAPAAEGNQRHPLFFSRLEATPRSGRNVQVHAASFLAVKYQSAIHFKKMIVTSDLNGTIASVAYEYAHLLAARVSNNWL